MLDAEAWQMTMRRQFLKRLSALVAGVWLGWSPFVSLIRSAVATAGKEILPRGTRRETLAHKNPADLDTGNLEVTPLEGFGTMGLSDYSVNLDKWRLEIAGQVNTPLRLKYEEILPLPSVERKVLLICPGFFANHGEWKGVSIGNLIRTAQAGSGATHVTVYGPEGTYEKTQRFPIQDVLSDKVFLAYQVNGKTLPRMHGYPLRVVAEGYYGSDWVKYVYKVTVDKISP
jgi:sulfoxide reductase catalytic subunit YedY